jgi:alpha-L-glutamate ligase-like protein/uncharacterized protein (TIGR02421 family)
MSLSLFNTGILGMNGRNLLYVKALNNSEAIRFADDKIKTKGFLAARKIPVPKLFGKISSPEEFGKFKWENLPEKFVLKPNAGYGGEGIIVIAKREDGKWISEGGKKYSISDLKNHVKYILRGEFAINNMPDIAFFEQKIESHDDLELFSRFGLPDIRIIVFNLVPVMAMLRAPGSESRGKANLHTGGFGIGIDLAKGETTYAIQKNKYIEIMPGSNEIIRGKKIPYWDEILLIASQIQTISTLGYLAVDIAIDKSGPVLLEINARAGLAVQIANREGLQSRLERIKKTKVTSPEKGVRLAQDLFGNKIEKELKSHFGKEVIGLEAEIELGLKRGGTKKIFARIDTQSEKNFLDEDVFEKMGGKKKNAIIDFKIKDTRSRGVFYPANLRNTKHQAIISSKILSNFLLDPTHKPEEQKTAIANEYALQKADEIICDIDEKISLISAVKPVNQVEEKIKFLSDKTYNPNFEYASKNYPLEEFRKKLKNLHLDDSPLGTLLAHKRSELLAKLDVLENIGNDEKFIQATIKLFGKPSESTIKFAKDLLKSQKKKIPHKKTYDATTLRQRYKKALREYGIDNWKIILKENLASRCTIGKNYSLLIQKDALFHEDEIKKLLVHELETHILTTLNGKNQPYRIFERGLSSYLETQEGLAIYNQESIYPLSKNIQIILGTILADLALKKSFRDVFEFALKHTGDEDTAWQLSVKAKRGVQNTEKAGGFPKNYLYLQGYLKVEEFLKKGGSFEDLYLGKINIDQLPIVKKIKEIKAPRYLPRFLPAQKA